MDADAPTGLGTDSRREIEERLRTMWCELLQLEHVDIYDDFIDIGGHSLAAELCAAKIAEVFDVRVPTDLFYIEPANIARLAAAIENKRQVEGL